MMFATFVSSEIIEKIGKEAIVLLQAGNRAVIQNQMLPSGQNSHRAMLELLNLHAKEMESGMGENLQKAVEQLRVDYLKQLKVEHDTVVKKWEDQLANHKNCDVTCKSKFDVGGIVADKASFEKTARAKHKQC